MENLMITLLLSLNVKQLRKLVENSSDIKFDSKVIYSITKIKEIKQIEDENNFCDDFGVTVEFIVKQHDVFHSHKINVIVEDDELFLEL